MRAPADLPSIRRACQGQSMRAPASDTADQPSRRRFHGHADHPHRQRRVRHPRDRAEPVAGAVHPRHPAPDRHPRRLRHHPVRRLHGARGRQGGEELQHARRAGRTAARSPPSRAWPRPTARCTRCRRPSASCHGLQCGFCTPGHGDERASTWCSTTACTNEQQVREALEGNICRCTGYHNIVKAVQQGAAAMKA